MNRSRFLVGAGLVIVALQGAATLALSRSEYLPSPPPLAELPSTAGAWTLSGDIDIDQSMIDMLAPDDHLFRAYTDAGRELSLFIGYYKTRHRARNAHDPKVCLPGSGWNALESRVITVPVQGGPIPVNYYVVKKDNFEAVVLYWYQMHNGAVAQEHMVRFDRVMQTLWENRTDMAFVRITIPVTTTAADARDQGVRFAQAFHGQLMSYFPP